APREGWKPPADAGQRFRTSPRRTPPGRSPDTGAGEPGRSASQPPRSESAGAGQLDQLREPPRFRASHLRAARRDAVISPSLVVQFWSRAFSSFDDQALLEHSLNRAVESPGAQFELVVRTGGDVLNDGVAVPVLIRQRHQNVEGRRRQRKKGICPEVIFGHMLHLQFHRGSATCYYIQYSYIVKGYIRGGVIVGVTPE